MDKNLQDNLIMIVEDDNTLRETLSYNLLKEGFKVIEASDGGKALEIYRSNKVSLVLLDVMLPVLNGFELCRIIQSEKKVPIIMLTAKTDEIDKVVGLELGADDYMTKPFSMRELLARIKAVLRRSVEVKEKTTDDRKNDPQFLDGGDIRIDLSRHIVYRGNDIVEA